MAVLHLTFFRRFLISFGAAVLFASAGSVSAGDVLQAPPSAPNLSAKYFFYMHGRHVERNGADGDYEYAAILGALAEKGLVVIGEVRSDTNPRQYSRQIASQVQGLLDAGVEPKNITVAGHSRGAFMSMIVSSRVGVDTVKYAILAGCGVEGSEFRRSYMKFSKRRARSMQGRFLVAWDADDEVTRDCDHAMNKAGVDLRNLEFKTGSGHRLFYRPEPVWIDPVAKFTLSD